MRTCAGRVAHRQTAAVITPPPPRAAARSLRRNLRTSGSQGFFEWLVFWVFEIYYCFLGGEDNPTILHIHTHLRPPSLEASTSRAGGGTDVCILPPCLQTPPSNPPRGALAPPGGSGGATRGAVDRAAAAHVCSMRACGRFFLLRLDLPISLIHRTEPSNWGGSLLRALS